MVNTIFGLRSADKSGIGDLGIDDKFSGRVITAYLEPEYVPPFMVKLDRIGVEDPG